MRAITIGPYTINVDVITFVQWFDEEGQRVAHVHFTSGVGGPQVPDGLRPYAYLRLLDGDADALRHLLQQSKYAV